MSAGDGNQASPAGAGWRFVLYIAGDRPVMRSAEATLRRLCERFLGTGYTIEIVDVLHPTAEVPSDILAVPVTVRTSPAPECRVVGDLSSARKAAEFLGLTEAELLDG